MLRYDAIIIGGGHNGLVCAAYLAGAGLEVLLLERRDIVGGAAVTETFHPGFRNSSASYTVSLLQPKIMADLRLAQHGLRIVNRPYANFLPLGEGKYLRSGRDPADTRAEIARHSVRDATNLDAYEQLLGRGVEILRYWLLRTPPGFRHFRQGAASVLEAIRARRMPAEQQRAIHELFTRSAGDLLDHYFESPALKAMFGFDAIVGSFTSPYAAGSAYVLMHHVFGETNGRPGTWGHAIGGMGAITQAMLAECRARGVTVLTEADVRQIRIRDQQVHGVSLADGREFEAAMVAAGVNPAILYQDLMAADQLPDNVRAHISRYRNGSGSFRINVALEQLPRLAGLAAEASAEAMQSGILLAPSLEYMEHAWLDARRDRMARQPVVEMLVPSTLDATLAPPGKHVASLFCQHFNPVLPAGDTWDDFRDLAITRILEVVETAMPGFSHLVAGLKAWSPLDLERVYGLTGGDIFHGQLGLDQLFSARPVLGFGDYRTPVRGVYLCGSGAHPGGGVTGAPGHNAAREILRDYRPS